MGSTQAVHRSGEHRGLTRTDQSGTSGWVPTTVPVSDAAKTQGVGAVDMAARPPAWRSGAALAVGGAVAAVGAHLSLRATSQGAPPDPTTLLVATAVLALVLWPLAARTTRVGSLAAVLVLAQVGTHLAVLMSTGGPTSAGPSGLFCSPPCYGTDDDVLARLTAAGGWSLFAAQLAACLILALAVHGSRRSLDTATAALELLRSVLRPLLLPLLAVLSLMLRQVVPARPVTTPRPIRTDPPAPTALVVARRLPRRGPPVLAGTAAPHIA